MENYKTEQAPNEVLDLIKQYQNIHFDRKVVVCPYYRNVKRVRAELRSLIGKGTPEEIEEELKIYSKLRGFSSRKKTEDEIREFMQSQGIGIDCSGFVSHVLDAWLCAKNKGRIWNNIKFPKSSFYRNLVRKLRPIENIGADLLTSELNTSKVDLKDIEIGDLLRLKGIQQGHHIAVVIEVVRDLESKVLSFKYAESSDHYGIENGVRIGEVQIVDENDELKEQKWLSVDENGICWTLKQLEKDYEDNGLRRLFFM